MDSKLQIKKADKDALAHLREIALRMKSYKDPDYFEKSLELQSAGEREVFFALWDGQVVGYTMLSYHPKYGYYRAHGIPEVQDLNVIPEMRQRGIGRALIQHCEETARKKAYEKIGIGVGLTPSYGAAQRLYVKMGYVPDGMGVTYDRQTVSHGEFRPFDDEVSLMMEKTL